RLLKYIVLRVVFIPVILLNLTPNQPFTVEKAISGERFDHNHNLQADADALLPLFNAMPSVPIYLKDEPILKSGTNTERGVAYTNCEGHEFPSIFMKKSFYEKVNRVQLINILKHELTHAWLCRQQLMAGHDERFRQKFRQVGGFGN
ncbi:MAG: SprT-like domain-containing protein, partial [Actinomycetota bacterium]